MPDRTRRVSVHAEPAALLFPVLVAGQYLWVAESATVLTAVLFAVTLTLIHVVHESGHAVAAVNAGGHADMRFGFVAGTVETDNVDELTLKQRAWIAVAGPAAAMVCGAVLLFVPLDPVRVAALFGIGFAVLDLVPFAPLDGHRLVVVYAESRGLDPDRALTVAGYVWSSMLIGVWAAALLTATHALIAVAAVTTLFTGIVVVARSKFTG